ncbi:MAG TPA: TolC family protein [Candidatus Phocaeicola gallinarum]|uniref:TolC family protein n=1 Tax=Bacteroides caecicola TaxID=1462569 RepID=UPI001C5C0975|nr:TolC family protein [Bacteroides caecicola]MCL1624527.1 TolC family protein [Bacteroides caecicola]HJC95076.1 TolC family protein [Candidatus Phocaeicola gallinarum]
MKRYRKITVLLFLAVGCGLAATAQEAWDVDRCMSYAVKHNRTVKQRRLEADNYRLDRLKAIGSFLPGISASAGVQYNFGRSVDPETNIYNNVSTFNNSYAAEASMTLFRGGSLVNEVRRSKAALLLGKAALQEAQDNTALETFQAYIDALYYYGTIRLAEKKLAESDSLLYKTRRQEELGLKGRADVAQMEAQQATDAYNLTHQRNLYETAMLTLKQKMNYPAGDSLLLNTDILDIQTFESIRLTDEHPQDVLRIALSVNPTLRQSEMNKQVARMNRKIAWANVLPTISFYGGISSSYYKELHNHDYPDFKTQLDNNLGEYFGVTMSIPIFNRMSGSISLRQARNNYRIACEQYEAQKEELQKLVQQAVQDREGYLRESIQMEKKAASDSLAYHVTRRKYEEGLMTSLDVQNNAATWLESETLLLQSRLTYVMKCRLVDYYKGENIIKVKTEN